MASDSHARGGDRLTTGVFALVGLAAGLLGYFVISDGPSTPVIGYIMQSNRAGVDSTLAVTFFGYDGHTRSAPDAAAFAAEVAVLQWAALAVDVLVGGLVGGLAGRWVGRQVRPPRRSPDSAPGATAYGGA